MLDRLLLKYLTKKGKIAYFVGLIVLFLLTGYYILGIAGYSFDSGRDVFFYSILVVNIVWAAICYMIWRKKETEEE